MNKTLQHIGAVSSLVYLRFLGIICIAACVSLPAFGQEGPFECFYTDDFTDSSTYTTRINDCDSNAGIFGVVGGRFTVNDMEGFGCNAKSGDANNELSLSVPRFDEYRNVTITFEYTIRDDADGFECTSVFGNGDDLIFMDVTVDGSTRRVNIFCEDTPGNINERKRTQVSIPNGTSLDVTIFAGTQTQDEYFYFDRIRLCGNKIPDPANPPVDPPPPPPVMGDVFEEETKAARCKSDNTDLIPALMSSIYSSFNDGSWFDSEDNAITEIIPSSNDLLPGDNLFRYKLPNGFISTFTLTIINDNLPNATFGPFCESTTSINLPQVINGYEGGWQGTGVANNGELSIDDLSLGNNNEVAFTPTGAGCLLFFDVDVIEQFGTPTIESCPPGVVNLLAAFPDLSKVVEEIDFRWSDDPTREITNPQSVDISTFSNSNNEFEFTQQIPANIGCGGSEVSLVVDANCAAPVNALEAVISIDRPDGNICEGDCGTLSVNISGGTPPYEIEFRADIPFTFPVFNIQLPPITFPNTNVSGDSYNSTICSAPDITIDDLFLQNDIVYDGATNTWNIPTFFAVRGTIGGKVIDADGTEFTFDNPIEIQAFEKPVLIPNLETRPDLGTIVVCKVDEVIYSDLQSALSDFDDFTFYDGETGPEITDFSSVDLTRLYATWANAGGCLTTRQKVAYDDSGACMENCPVRPVIPEFDAGGPAFVGCSDGTFTIDIKTETGITYDWFLDGDNTAILADSDSFSPPGEGDYYVNAFTTGDPTCRSNNLFFSFSFYEPSITIEDCQRSGSDISYSDISLGSGENLINITPNVAQTNLGNNTWRLLGFSADTDYTLTIENADGCRADAPFRINSADCPEATCDFAGDETGPISIPINNGTSAIVDLTEFLLNETAIGTFLDENGDPILDPTAFEFTGNVIITHVIDAIGSCPMSSVELNLTIQGASIDGTVCADDVFCDQISIGLTSGVGSGAPFTMRFEMFDAAVIQEIVFEESALVDGNELIVTVCVSGTENIYDRASKTLFIAEGTPAGDIRVQELRDSNGDLLGTVPTIAVDFSPLPRVNSITDVIDVCMSQSNEYPITDLNRNVSPDNGNSVEWWYEQPSDPNTVAADRVLADAAVNPNDIIYALVTSPDNCKVEIPVNFTLVADDEVNVAYNQFYCLGDPVIPVTLETNGFDIDFNYSPKSSADNINRRTGEISNPIVGTEYTVSWITPGVCGVSDSTRIMIIPAGDARCSCPFIEPPTIVDANLPPQPQLEGNGIEYCADADEPDLRVSNNPGNLTTKWFSSRAETNLLQDGGDVLTNPDDRVNYFVRFEDANGCGSELTPVFTIRNNGQILTTRNISICADNQSSVDLTSFLVSAEGFTVDWFDPMGNEILDPTDYDGAGLPVNEQLIFDQEYIDPNGCGDDARVQFTITDYSVLQLDNFVCNAAENFYTLEFEAPSHWNISSDVGVVSESDGIYLVDSVQIGTNINLSINDNFNNCPYEPATIISPACNCDALPDPRDVDSRDTICFGDQFEIRNPQGTYTVNWYDDPSGGVRRPESEIFPGVVAGTYYAEIIDIESSCVSERKPFVVLENVPSPLRNDLNTQDLITCQELQDSFVLSNPLPGLKVVWLDNNTREVIHEGNSFRPDEVQFPAGASGSSDYEFIAAYQNDFGCMSTVGQALTYRIYARPNLVPVDTICSEDLRSVTFEFDTRGVVLEPLGTISNADGNFEISGLALGEDIDITIVRQRTGVDCELMRTVTFDPTNTCPCPSIDPPALRQETRTVCDNVTDFAFEVDNPGVDDLVANWYDNAAAVGTPLLENSLFFSPQDSGAYYVRFIDTITGCVSDSVMINLLYDSVPDAGLGQDMTVCGLETFNLDTLLLDPINPDGFWRDSDGIDLADNLINTADYDYAVPLVFEYIVVATNGQRCSDTLRTTLTIQTPFNPGIGQDLSPICDQAAEMIDFDAAIGVHDAGIWVDNDMTGIDLNQNPMINSNDLAPGEYVFTFLVDADDVCDSNSSDVRVNILALPEVGVDTRDSICSGSEFGYSFVSALDGTVDLSGSWEDVDNVLPVDINADPGLVDLSTLPAGDYTFRYSLASGSCSASSDLLIHVFEDNRAGQDTLVQVCNTSSLMLNFERVLPDANAYNLSIDGDFTIDFSSFQNVDFTSLPSGSYRIRNLADSFSECTEDEAIVDLVIEAAPRYPDIAAEYDVCFGDTIDLSELIGGDGIFTELILTGAIAGDTLFAGLLPADIPQPISFVIAPDSVCAPDPQNFIINPASPPSAGADIDIEICQGDSVDLLTLLGTDADPGGVFEDIEGTGQLVGSILYTELLDESSPSFSYTVGDGLICPTDLAIITVDIRATPNLVDSLSFLVCQTEASGYNLQNVLGGLDVTGEWLDPDGTGIDFTDPTNVDLSMLDLLQEYNIQYALSNGMCADTVLIDFEIDQTVNPGQAGVFIQHCEGDSEVIDLNDLLDDEDQGVWFDENGDMISTSAAFDLGLLAANNYNFKHVVRNGNLGYCPDDSVTIQILVEPPPDAGANDTITLCQSVTFDLTDLLDLTTDASGVFTDVDNHGNLTGSLVSTGTMTPGAYDYYYILETNASCDPDTAIFTILLVTDIEAGEENSDIICQGELYDLVSLVLTGDPGGRFENADTQAPYTDVILNTDGLSGVQNIWYIVESASCASDTAALTLDIRVTPDLGADIDFALCESDATSVNFLNELSTTIDQSGQWIDLNNLGLDLSDPSSVDVSGITPLTPSTLGYTVANAECADTIAVTFTIDAALFAGEAGVMFDHCAGRPGTRNLYDLFTDVDQGTWSIDGVDIADPTSFDLSTLAAGMYTLTHNVVNPNLGVCPNQSQTVSLQVFPAVSAGIDVETTLCQNINYDLLNLVDASADQGGVFVDINNVGNLTGNEITTTGIAEGKYDYYYIVSASANCEPDSALLEITVVTEIDAGQDNGAEECQGTDFDLTSLILDGDPGGTFINVDSGVTYTDPNLVTDNLTAEQMIIYVVESPSCVSDTATYLLTINPSYDLMEAVNIAEGDSILIDGIWRFDAETIVVPGLTVAGCDSTVTTVLTISDVAVEVTGVSCMDFSDGIISVQVTAGVAPFNIMYVQTDGNLEGETTLNRPATLDYDMLPQGTYRVTVEDATGEMLLDEDVIIGVENQIIPTVVSMDASCFGFDDGSLTISELLIEGVPQSLDAYTYSWSSGDLTSASGKLEGGFYQVVITDTLTMCPFEFEYFVGQPDSLSVQPIINDFQCGGAAGSIELDILSSINDLATFSMDGGPEQTVGLFTDLDAGFYSIRVDYGDCFEVFDSLQVREASDNVIEVEPNDVTLITGQTEEINVLINFQAIDVEWSSDLGLEGLDTTSQLNPILTATETGEYYITATDGFGCTVTDTLIVEVIEFQDPVPDIYIPNVFNPLSTNGNNRFAPLVEENYPGTFEIQIYNRWGNIIYDNIEDVYGPNAGWDGMYNGRLVEIGVYTYVIQFQFENGTYLKRTGDLTVVY